MVRYRRADRGRKTNSDIAFSEKVKYCLQYEGKGAPNTLNLDLRIQLDAKKSTSPRAFFLRKDFRGRSTIRVPPGTANPPDVITQRVQLTKGRELCELQDFYVAVRASTTAA